MARALEVIVRANGWFMQDVRVWLVNARGPLGLAASSVHTVLPLPFADTFMMCAQDYHSVPQANKRCQRLAIDSIILYASYSDAFCACAPLLQRVETGQTLDSTSYTRRMW